MDFLIRPRVARFEPNADVFVDEERGQVVVTLEIAGADPGSLAAVIEDRHLLVAGRRTERAAYPRGSLVQKEIAYGEFAKRIQLPVAVEEGNAIARFRDGILVLVLPIAPTAYLQTSRTEVRITLKRTHS